MTTPDRRKNPRITVDLPVRCAAGGVTFPGHLKDICRDAALVEVHHACALDSRVVLTLELPGGGALEVAGRVIRLGPGEGDTRGMAILFTEATPAAVTRIDLLLSKLA